MRTEYRGAAGFEACALRHDQHRNTHGVREEWQAGWEGQRRAVSLSARRKIDEHRGLDVRVTAVMYVQYKLPLFGDFLAL